MCRRAGDRVAQGRSKACPDTEWRGRWWENTRRSVRRGGAVREGHEVVCEVGERLWGVGGGNGRG
jgi:hypothetical protein